MNGILQVAHVERLDFYRLQLIELLLVGINRNRRRQKFGMRQIIALAGCNLTSEHYRHSLGRAVGEEEIEFCRLDGEQFGRAIELGCHLFLHISHRNLSRSRFFVGIIGKPECERMNLASVSIGNECESLIAHRNMHGISEFAGYHRIAGHAR